MVRGIREVLCFKAHPGPIRIHGTDTGRFAVHEVARVELYAGLRGADLERAPALGLGDSRRQGHPRARLVEYPVVIVATPQTQLLIVGANAGADGVRRSEVEWRSGDRPQLT